MKKRRYVPGWQLKQKLEDKVTREKADKALDEYYERQRILDKIQEAEEEQKKIEEQQKKLKYVKEAQQNDTVQTNTPDTAQTALQDSVQPIKNVQQPIVNQQPVVEQYGRAYNTESAQDYLNRTKDETLFSDQFIRTPLDPDYADWSARQAIRAAENSYMANDLSSKAATASMKLQESIYLDQLNGKESVPERMQRRIREHTLFSTVDQKKGLTAKEQAEIVQFRAFNDPMWGAKYLNEISGKQQAQEDVDTEEAAAVQRPDNYTGQARGIKGLSGVNATLAIQTKLQSLANSLWAKSFLSDFILKTNDSQMKTSIGQIQRSKEFVDLSSNTMENVDRIEQLANNIRNLRRLDDEAGSNGIQSLSPEKQHIYAQLLDENRQIRSELDKTDWWKNANNLASWAPTKLGYISGIIDKVIDDDIGGIRNGLYGLDDKLDELKTYLQQNKQDDAWLEGITNTTGKIKRQLTDFNANNAYKQDRWREQALTDLQDIVEWKEGNNWLGMHASVDPYYKAQETLLEKSGFKWNDPVKMAQFGWSGVAGGSNSSWWKSIISIGSKVGGAIGGAMTTGGTSAVIQGTAIAASFEADKSAGSDENNIESEDRTGQRLRNKLIADKKYDQFIKEGAQQLGYKKVNKDAIWRHTETVVQDALKQYKDKQDSEAFILDAFLAGMWHSADPEITKMHADAVIGTNNQFYNNQPVNTADAAIGSIVDIANLNAVKYLARCAKIVKTDQALRLGRFAQRFGKAHPDAALRYYGFKEGIHNVGVKLAESKIAKMTEAGIIKGLNAAEKAPIGAIIGSTLGVDAGLELTDGSIAGGVLGGVAGGVLGIKASGYLGKGLKFIGVEDKIANLYQKTRAFATSVPSAWLKAASVGKTGAKIGGRVTLDTASEMEQEGVQAQNARGDENYDVQYNRPLALRIFNDMMLGARSAYIWANQNDPEMQGEADVWSQMNATPLLTLLGPGIVQVGVQLRNGVHDYEMIQAIQNNIDAERRGNVAELEQGRSYAKYVTSEQKEVMHKKFDAFRKIAGAHKDAKEKLGDSLMDGDEHYIPSELIDEQEKDYEDIYELANSVKMRVIGARANTKPGTDKYAKLVSYENFASKRQAQKLDKLQEIDERNAKLLGEDALPEIQSEYSRQAFSEESFGEELPTGETISAEQQSKQRLSDITNTNTPGNLITAYNRAKMLMQTLALYRIVQDYSTLKDITGREDTFLNRSKAKLNELKKLLKQQGIDIQTDEDILTALNMSDEGMALRQMLERSNQLDEESEALSWTELLDSYSDMLRDRELAEYDFILADQQLKEFHRNPEKILYMWDRRRKADRTLEGILEEEYVNTIRSYERAAAREVKDGDTYLGRDGQWYKVKQKGDDYVKYRYYPYRRSKNVDNTPLQFDPVEYDEYWTEQENKIVEREKAKKATENIQTGNVKQDPNQVIEHGIPPIEPPTNPEEDGSQSFLPGQYVEITDPTTGDKTTGIVRGVNPDDNTVEVETPGGEPVIVPNNSNILSVLNSPISVRKYPSGTILTGRNGKKYTIASSKLVSINEDTMEGQYQYDVIDIDTNGVTQMSEQDIDDMINTAPAEESFEESKEQKDVRALIEEKIQRDKKVLGGRKPTPHDYFIKVKNKIQRFLRVHSILDPLFDEDRNTKEDRLQLEQELRRLYNEDKKEYVKKVKQLQEEYNKQLLDKFGESSYEYKFYKIDLSLYLSGPRLYDQENPAIISTIITDVVTNPALVVGTHIDKIARLFFARKNPQNEPEYCMSDEVFNSVIDQLKNLDQRFKQLKWSVYTEELTWYGQMSNGIGFAGTTDLIAVDQQGRIHVLDFKTTANATRFDIKYQKRGVIRDIEGTIIEDHGWITVADKSEIQPEDEWRITSSFLEETATKDYGQTVGNRTYAAQYARQLAAYRYLIQQELGPVASLEIIPFYVGYKTDANGRLADIHEVYMYDPINLSDVEEIKQELQDVDDFLNDKSEDWNEAFQAAKRAVNSRIEYIRSLISDSHLSDELRIKLDDHITGLFWELGQYEKAVNDKTKTTDSVFMQQLADNVETEFQKAGVTIEQANKQISDAEAAEEAERNKNKGKGSESESGPIAAGAGSGGRSWLFDPLEKVVDSARRFWNQFNNLHSWSDFVVYMPGYMQAIIQRDFITNSKFVITRDDKNNFDLFKVTITYRGHTFDPITIRLGNDAELDEDKNKDIQADDSLYSLMGRNFLKQFYQLRSVMKPGDTIIATNSSIERTNGKLVYGEDIAKDALNYSLGLKDNFIKYIEHRNLPKSIIDKVKACSTVEEMVSILSQETNLQDTAFFDQDDPRYGHMLDGERSIIGVVDERGNIVEITTGTRMPLLSPAEDLDGNLKNPKVRQYVKPGNNTETIPAGVVMFLYRFKNEEDAETQPERIIPIALKGMKLGEKKNGVVEPSKIAKYVVAILKSMASGKKPHSELEVQAINKDGSKKFVKINGYDHLKALNIITRFGQQAWYAGHEFIFDFARDESSAERELLYGHTVITITDMRAEPREVNGMLHRDTINLNLGDEADIQALYEILSELEMHINQFGEAKFKLNTQEAKGPFGDIMGFFAQAENSDVQSVEIIPGITIDREDVEKGLSGIEWAIKHGIAKTNALSVTNPLISIHELDIDGRKPKLPEEKPEPVIGTSGPEDNGLGEETNLGNDNDAGEQHAQTGTGESSEPEQKGGKPAPEVTDEEIRRAKSRRRRGTDYGTLAVSEEELRPMAMTTKQRNKAERNLRRLVGKLPVRWSPNAIKVLQSGAKVAGKAALAGFELYDRIPKGGEYHEAFHRIFEILMPNSIRESLYEEYRNKYNESFKQERGRDLTDKDISENFAELFRHFMIDRDPIKIHLNLLKTFKEIRDFIQGLRNLGSRRFAMLFLAANSGVFRFIRPNEENVKHFMTALDGEADMTISARVGKERKTIKLNEFPPVGGKDLLNDAVDSIIYALCTNYSIDYLARNASRLKTNLASIQMLYKGEEKTTHSSWFRVITGEYANEGDQMTVDDAFTYWDMYEFSDQMKNITRRALEGMPKEDRTDDDKVEYAILREILKTEGSLTKDQLDPRQRMLGELFSKKVWPFIEQRVNNKLHKMGLDSELVSYDEYIKLFEDQDGEEDDTGQPNQAGKDASDHKDEFFDHSRTDDATAAIRFFLSSIPDEHFATQDDVDAGIVDYTTREVVDKDGTVREEPVLVKNNSSLFGFKVFLSMKAVSQKLLSVCNNVRNAEQLDELLQDLASDDPVFYRIAKKYHAAKQNEIIKTKDGKNAIMYDGLNVDQSDYFQHKDENGYYYTWAKDGEDTGVRMVGAVTQTDPDMESFVTQLFNYVACQRLDFIRVKFSQRLDEEGEPLDGQYISEVRKTSDDYASRIFPIQWFERLRGGFSGIFRMTTGGKYTFTEDGKKKLDHAISTINTIYKIVRENKKIKLDGVQYDKARQDDFLKIENAYINALNDLGIDITREAFEFGLRERFGRKEPLSIQMGKFFGLADPNGVSYKKFTKMIKRLQKNATESGKNEILSLSQRADDSGRGRFDKGQEASGTNLYSDNSVVKWFAKSVSAYNKSTKELMTNGPENTKRYLMAQSHTISDMTVDINDATSDDSEPLNTRKVKNSRILKDMQKYLYNFLERGKNWDLPIGSIIIKHVLQSGGIHLTLHTHGGIMVDEDLSGGVSYKKITEREDWLAKAAILKQGGIIFPTLSDKSTWFYVTGVTIPGINYYNIESMSKNSLPELGLHEGEDLSSDAAHIIFDWNRPNAQIDQMIEYAECEMAAIEREINRKKKLPIIEYFNENRKRFGGLTEIVKINEETGEPDVVLFNDYDLTPEECLALAKREFFDLPIAEQRKRMALTLETGFWENVRTLEHAGVIVADGKLRQQKLDKDGNPTGETILQNRLLQYSNVGLDSEVIKELTAKYMESVDENDKDGYADNSHRAEAKAIVAHIWDIYMRGVISNEEVERIYIGQPQFFKWISGKIKDALSGKTMHCLIDRFSDQSKRLGGAGSTGEKNRLDLVNTRRTYVCAEIEDVKVKSALYDDFKRIVKISSIKQAYLDWKTQQIKNETENYEELQEKLNKLNDDVYKNQTSDKEEQDKQLEAIRQEMESGGVGVAYDVAVKNAEDVADTLGLTKPADGAAFISPECAKTLLRMRGKFTSEVKKAFEYLEGEDSKSNVLRSADAYKIVTEAIIGTQKYSAYGYRINAATDEIPVHYYDKFALFPLFKFMATGFTADLYRKMQEGDEQGRPIDMVMMHSGVKTGSEQPGMFDPSKLRVDDNDDNEQNWEHDEETGKRTKLKPTVEDFQFHTYEQDYSFIRRQLNTDPHEKNTTTMGTQMTKVALSNIKPNMEYTLQDGTPIRGRELLDRIMGSIKALSNLGKEKIKSQLLNEDGTIDIDKFSEFLEEELDQRDADANLIDGIEVVEEEEVDKVTGEVRKVKRFNVELEAMSSVDWIQSIIVSKINKEVCDINVKGNAFYQRPAWGVEGKPLILDDATVDFAKRGINNGEKLNVINNDGSMDAVISLDFFYDILPEGIRDNFEKSREWLFKHKIIGNTPDVHANCINARIPTQAQSSIGALRFVDVIPVVRDTIILPQEITGIDGSDFDIDKRYLVRLSYNITYGKDRNTEDIVSTIFDEKENPEDFYRNKLINDYLILLKSHGILTDHGLDWADSSHTSLSSIDKDTKLVTDVRDKINKNKPKKRYYAFQFGNIAFQVITKLKFMVGKFGIGPFALNNNNQILTQLYNVVFAKAPDYTNILDALGCLSLANEVDKQGHRILSWLSGLINVHVDIAKNPDSIDGLNINTYTYNLVNLLIRTGMGERGLFLTAQPVMTELSRVYDDASGSFMTDPNKSKSAKQRDAINDFLYDNFASRGGRNIKEQRQRVDKFMLNERVNTQEEQKQYEEIIGSYAKALFGIDNNGRYIEGFKYITPDGRIITKTPVEKTNPKTGEKYKEGPGCILEDVLTNPEVLKDVRNGATFDNLDDREAYVVFVKDESGNTVEMRWSAKQVQEAVAYVQNNLNIYARHLSDLVNACKIDTKKHGKNYVEQQAYLDKYNQVFENKDGIFEQAGLDDLRKNSYVDTKTHNAIDLYELILKQFSIQATDSFKKVHNKIIERLNSSVQNKVLSSKITKAIMTHIKLDFFSKYCEQRGENYYQDLLYGDNTVQYKLLHLQNSIRNDKTGKYHKYGSAGIITNPLLKALQADVYENRNGFDNPKLIIMQDALLDDKDTANALERAWDELFNDYEHYTEDAEGNKTYYVREFAIDLAVYAFMTSGDVGGRSKFFKFVPNTIRKYLSANINGEEMSYNTYIRRTRENWQNKLSDEEAEAIAKEVIYENWTDNDFVRPVRMYTSKIITDRETGRKRRVKNFQLTTKMYYTDKSTQNVRKYSKRNKKYYFVAQTIEKKILSIIAGAKKVGKELVETIYRNGDNYPLYIKVRRQSSYYRDNDNMILYEYQGQNELDPENPQNGTYPVYRIVLPKVAKFRAGTYQYSLYGINDGQRSCVYPISVLEALELMQHESPVSESKDKTQLLKDIQDSFNKMAIWMADDELEDFLIKEYQMNGIDDTSNIQKDLETLKSGLDVNKSISERQKQEGDKSKKVEIHYESDNSVDIWWGSDPKERKNGILSNLAPRKVKFNGITYPSVEAAWQAQKLSYADMPAKEKKLVLLSLQASDGIIARSIGSDPKVIKNLNTEKWDSVKDDLMHDIIKASLEQNKDVMKLLLSTKDAKLTHLKASLRSEWRTKFPEILSQVRSELAKQYKNSASESQSEQGQILESSGDYPQRTKENAQWSDITLDITETNKGSGGVNELTKRVAGNKYVHFQLHDSGETSSDPDAIFASIKEAGLPTTNIKLNIAGSEIGRLKHTQEEYNNEVERLIKGLLDLGVTISEIRSGGQTGIDEAGIIAAQKLGIKWSVNAPNGFKFRTKDGIDISDKDKFMSRFGITKKQKPQAKPATIIDISKDEEFNSLSNTANRSITINGNEFPTVMHAYNYAIVSAAKVDAETRAKYQQAILSATSMRDIQNAVSEVVDIAGEKPLSQDVLDSLLYKLMYMSFDQNPESVGVLLNTENAEFKGVSDKVAENLKKIRDKFRQDEEENTTDDNEFDDAAEKACDK